MIRFGICASSEEAAAAIEAGFDYIEGWAAKLFGESEVASRIPASVECTNGFFGPEIRLYANLEESIELGIRTAKRGAEFGLRVMVVGSGNARRAPESSVPGSFDRVFVSAIAAIQAKVPELSLAPEPLNVAECNVGNDLGRLAKLCAEANLAYCADSYHVLKEWERSGTDPSLQAWREAMPTAPIHVHISGADRRSPRGDDPALKCLVERLRELNYQGRVSVEAGHEPDVESLCSIREELGLLFS
jgi:sugar phosphate isomerase/epimerase